MPLPQLFACLAVLLVGGCSSIPEGIRTPLAGPSPGAARTSPERHAGSVVRWGGTLSAVRNFADRTVLTVVARPLARDGEPLAGRSAQGRFLAVVGRFLEPEEYPDGTRITVVGRFSGIRQAPIDQYLYNYPVVRVTQLYRWPEPLRPAPYVDPFYYPYPYWHDPFWHHRHGFRHRSRFRFGIGVGL